MADILRIDLTTGATQREATTGELAEIGGRGLTSSLVAAEVDPTSDPLGTGNLLVFANGVLAGTSVPNGGRLSVGAKSPLTGTIKEANAGGAAGRTLANLGLRALAVTGSASELSVLEVDAEGSRITSAPGLAGLGTYDTMAALRATYGDDAALICCGPAGEMQLKAAAVIVSTPDFRPRTASRGGLGAVMGSKNLKAVVIRDGGRREVAVADKAALKTAVSAFSEGVRSHGPVGAWEALGTAFLINVANGIGCLATKNYSAGAFEGAEALSGERMAELLGGRPNSQMKHRCMAGCIINCSQVYTDVDGTEVTSGFEFETLTLVGSNCTIADLDQVAALDRLCDDIGLDTIETGAALAVAMEGGMLPWGDGQAAHDLVSGIRQGAEQAVLIGNGCVATGAALGVTRVPAVKGQSLAAWEPRVLKGTGVTYATSPMGADHTAGNALPSEQYDCTVPEGQAQMSQFVQSWFAAVDSIGLCLFASVACLDIPPVHGHLRDAVAAILGRELPEDFLPALGAKVVLTERDFNRRAGFTTADDRLPAFMTTDPLPPTGLVFDVPEGDLDTVFA